MATDQPYGIVRATVPQHVGLVEDGAGSVDGSVLQKQRLTAGCRAGVAELTVSSLDPPVPDRRRRPRIWRRSSSLLLIM